MDCINLEYTKKEQIQSYLYTKSDIWGRIHIKNDTKHVNDYI